MGFAFYPKHEHDCPNLSHCPHIGGAAIGRLVSEANHNIEHYGYLLRQVDAFREENHRQYREIQELQDEVKRLKAELTEERRKKFRRSAD